ncbi:MULTISPECIES: hypothetical protein [Streptomyces]|uniref:hypothetical protein n=1 Tax=Streptomyces TaxID=1883 RepID=UPI00131A5EB0|nr:MULTISPECIES: hypothetical protein [Streptomyces]MDP9954188.1 hypothetical protein [Streptomyces sp. DSM 41269]
MSRHQPRPAGVTSVTLRRLGLLPAALLTALALTACTAEPSEADDPKAAVPPTSTPASSGAPGGPPEGGLLLADAMENAVHLVGIRTVPRPGGPCWLTR